MTLFLIAVWFWFWLVMCETRHMRTILVGVPVAALAVIGVVFHHYTDMLYDFVHDFGHDWE